MTWKTFRSRGEILRSVIAVVNTRRDGLLPFDIDGVAEAFGDELSLLGALQLKWHTRLNGHIERQLLSQPMDLRAAVIAAWCGVAEELPGVRAVIDHYREHPVDDAMAAAIAKATIKEHAFLATMAGLASVNDPAGAPLGAELEDRARARHARTTHVVPLAGTRTASRVSLLDRLRAVLAA